MSNGKRSKKRCKACGFRRRGSNHDNGSHHQDVVRGRKLCKQYR